MIEESDVERAVDWIRDNAVKAAQARANREHLDDYRRVLKAQLMQRTDGPLAAQERDAYASAEYIAHLEGLKVAIEEDERFRWLLKAAETKISVWQSMQRAQRTGV